MNISSEMILAVHWACSSVGRFPSPFEIVFIVPFHKGPKLILREVKLVVQLYNASKRRSKYWNKIGVTLKPNSIHSATQKLNLPTL